MKESNCPSRTVCCYSPASFPHFRKEKKTDSLPVVTTTAHKPPGPSSGYPDDRLDMIRSSPPCGLLHPPGICTQSEAKLHHRVVVLLSFKNARMTSNGKWVMVYDDQREDGHPICRKAAFSTQGRSFSLVVLVPFGLEK